MVARVAAKNLTADTRTKIAAILGTNDAALEAAMADAATWPDQIDKVKTKTGNWHFIDVPVTAPFALGTLCATHDCVLDRIAEMSDRLRTNQSGFTLASPPSPPRPMTSQEMAFLIHFVGDIHQPLHSANDGDRGGNCENLVKALKSGSKELHAVWDTDEVLAVFQVLGNEDATSAALFQQFKDGAQVAQAAPVDWAHEANDLARQDIYKKLNLPNHTGPAGKCASGIAKVAVDQAYLDGNEKDVERQLLRAGIRLSNLLNEICSGDGCQANPGGNGKKKK